MLATLGAAFLLGACTEEPAAPPPAAPSGFVPDRKPAPPVRWADTSIATGTELALTIDQEISSAANRTGDRFQARIARAYMEGNRVVIPEGSVVEGVIEAVLKLGKQGGAVILGFERIVTPTGADAEMRARPVQVAGVGEIVRTQDGTAIAAGAAGQEVILAAGAAVTIALEKPLDIKVRI
jgi:hypothetical protein